MKPKKEKRPDVQCLNPHCKKQISPGRDGRRKYCNNACKQAAYRARRDGTVTGTNA